MSKLMRNVIVGIAIVILVCLGTGCGKNPNQKEFQIIVLPTENGSVETVKTATKGQDVTVTIKPAIGYFLKGFEINEKNKFSEVQEYKYTIKNVKKDITIGATFAPGVAYATQKPVIDGEIDVSWINSARLYTHNHYRPNSRPMDFGYASMMWDEEYLYILGVVDDLDISEEDRINFWISESYLDTKKDISYSDNATEGKYYVSVTPNGNYKDYGNQINYYEVCETKATKNEYGYVVEMKIRKQTESDYKAGHMIGFDVSIDTYFSGETERAKDDNGDSMYCDWNGEGSYWKYASNLAPLILLD